MTDQPGGPEYSVVVPIFNEEQTLSELVRRLQLLLDRLDASAEVVLVDDGSSDRSYDLMLAARETDPRFKVLRLSRNFGHQIAITAGMDVAAGNAVIVMDADLQDPPGGRAARWRPVGARDSTSIYGVREERPGETRFKKATASAFYRLLRRISNIDVPLDVGDFRLVDRRALEAFKAMRETNRYVRGMFSWIGFRQVGVSFQRDERFAGDTKYPLTQDAEVRDRRRRQLLGRSTAACAEPGVHRLGALFRLRAGRSWSPSWPACTRSPALRRSRSSSRSSAASSCSCSD